MPSPYEAWDLCPITIRLCALMRAQSIFVGSIRKKGMPHRTFTNVKPREKYFFSSPGLWKHVILYLLVFPKCILPLRCNEPSLYDVLTRK